MSDDHRPPKNPESAGRPFKKRKQDATEPDLRTDEERINDQVTPFWRKSYPDQLVAKDQAQFGIVQSFLKALNQRAHKANQPLVWLQPLLKTSATACSFWSPIQASPEASVIGYRSKCEFSFGRNRQNEVTLGFMMGLFKEGTVEVASAQSCLHVQDGTKQVVQWMETYVREQSKWPVYDRVSKGGNWRLLMTRHQLSGEMMVVVQMHPQNMSKDDVEQEQQHVAAYLQQQSASSPVKVTTLLWQMSDGVTNGIFESPDLELIFGPGHIHETLNIGGHAFSFRISPFSFFQSSTLACEKLFETIGQWAVPAGQKKTVLLDLCCGTGTIGICMSRIPSIHRIIGIEMCKEAVQDAKYNASLNGLKEDVIEYRCGKVEDELPIVLGRVKAEFGDLEDVDVVAVLDPPRAGVHKSVVNAIRQNEFIRRVVYVSCNPKAASDNWVKCVLNQEWHCFIMFLVECVHQIRAESRLSSKGHKPWICSLKRSIARWCSSFSDNFDGIKERSGKIFFLRKIIWTLSLRR